MNFRKRAEMLVLFPKVQLAAFTDNTMPRRDWSAYDEPTVSRRRVNVAKLRRGQTTVGTIYGDVA